MIKYISLLLAIACASPTTVPAPTVEIVSVTFVPPTSYTLRFHATSPVRVVKWNFVANRVVYSDTVVTTARTVTWNERLYPDPENRIYVQLCLVSDLTHCVIY